MTRKEKRTSGERREKKIQKEKMNEEKTRKSSY